jgi:hypothetical protein
MGFGCEHGLLIGKGLRLAAMAAGIFACVGGWGGAPAQTPGATPVAKTMLMEPPTPLLPATLGKLKRVAEGDSGDGLGQMDAAGVSAQDKAVLQEDGLKRFARSDYAPGAAQGAGAGNVTVYQFADASGAVSAYDYFRKPEMRPEKLGDAAVSNGDELLMRSGVNVVVGHLKLDRPAMLAVTKDLIDRLPKAMGPAALPPPLPTLLPAKGLEIDSVKYALGRESYGAMGGVLPPEIVGFDKSAETVTARYKGGGVLTLLAYPTPEIAGDHGRAVEAALQQQGAKAGTVKLRREGPLLLLTTGAWPAAEAQRMVDGIHLRSEMSLDKPMPLEFHAELQKTYSLLESIVIFSGVGALAAMILGLFLGFGRAAVRVMMGKPAAAEPEFLRIDLSGGPGKNLRGPQA